MINTKPNDKTSHTTAIFTPTDIKCQDKPYANAFFLNFTFPSACQQSCRNFLHLETLMPCSPIQKPVLLNKKIVMHHY